MPTKNKLLIKIIIIMIIIKVTCYYNSFSRTSFCKHLLVARVEEFQE